MTLCGRVTAVVPVRGSLPARVVNRLIRKIYDFPFFRPWLSRYLRAICLEYLKHTHLIINKEDECVYGNAIGIQELGLYWVIVLLTR